MEDLSWVLEEPTITAEELEWEHRMDISASIYARMKEAGLNESELAEKLGVDKSQISRLINGKRNISLSTLAKIEIALDFRLDEGFLYYMNDAEETTSSTKGVASVSLTSRHIPHGWAGTTSGRIIVSSQTTPATQLKEAA